MTALTRTRRVVPVGLPSILLIGACMVSGVASAACGQGVDLQTMAGVLLQQDRQDSARDPVARWPIRLEFDLPREFGTETADGASAVVGFRVGYFRVGDVIPLQTLDFEIDRLTVVDGTAHVLVPRPELPEGVDAIEVRLQTIALASVSTWSEATPAVALPTSRAVPRPRGVTLEDVRAHPALANRLAALVPPGEAIEDVLTAFRQIEEVARAAAASGHADVPFMTLVKTMKGPPRSSLRRALGVLRPNLRANEVMRTSRAEARKLLEDR